MKSRYLVDFGVRTLVAALLAAGSVSLKAQNPVSGAARTEMVRNLRPSGQPVIPIFEGWYPKVDGTFDLCFGYFNLNTEQVVDIPLGPSNYIEPARFNGRQPTHFDVVPDRDLRHFCVFAVNVPADFGTTNRVVWTLGIDGKSYSVPGHLRAVTYRIQEPDMPSRGSVAPLLRFLEPAGQEGRGRSGVMAGPVTTKLESSLPVRVEVIEPITSTPHSKFEIVTALWAKHQGPGEVTFRRMDDQEGSGTSAPKGTGLRTTATFSEPGDYLLRVQAFSGRRPQWQSQCCWTNGYVKVTVTP